MTVNENMGLLPWYAIAALHLQMESQGPPRRAKGKFANANLGSIRQRTGNFLVRPERRVGRQPRMGRLLEAEAEREQSGFAERGAEEREPDRRGCLR